MSKTKRLLSVILAAVIILQAGAFTVSGESAEDDRQIITISNIDTSQLAGGTDESSTEIGTKGLDSDKLEIVSEEWTNIAEYVISGTNISIKGGKYSYRLVIRSDRTLTFDNDLEIYYQGVNGRYRLHYDIDETDNHTMVVTGVFDNIIIASPLLQKISAAEREWILAHISRDSYFYQLVLKTKEGFSFINSLRFLIDAKKCGYSAKYSYDLKTDKQTLIICGIPDCCSNGPEEKDGSAEESVQEEPGPDGQAAERTTDRNNADAAADVPGDVPQDAAVPPEALNTVVVRCSKLRKKAQAFKLSKLPCSAGMLRGRMRYAKVSGNKRITVDKKTGKVTLKRGLKKGAYNVTVKMTPAGKADRKVSAASRITFTVVVI